MERSPISPLVSATMLLLQYSPDLRSLESNGVSVPSLPQNVCKDWKFESQSSVMTLIPVVLVIFWVFGPLSFSFLSDSGYQLRE